LVNGKQKRKKLHKRFQQLFGQSNGTKKKEAVLEVLIVFRLVKWKQKKEEAVQEVPTIVCLVGQMETKRGSSCAGGANNCLFG